MPKELPDDNSPIDQLRPFSNVRLIIADLDGTLLNPEDPHIWDNFNTQIRSNKHYKVKFTIATGRTLHGVKNFLKKLNLPKNRPIILYNGSLVIFRDSNILLFKKNIPSEIFEKIIKKLSNESIQLLAYIYDETLPFEDFSNVDDPEIVFGWSNIGQIQKEFNQMNIRWKEWDDIPDTYNSLLAILIRIDDKKTLTNIKRKLKDFPEITITKSGSQYLEIRPTGSNKAIAAEQILKKIGYTREEVLSIGDNDNDAELLEWSGIGVAVKGASKKALNACKYVTKYNSASGVVGVLRLVKESRRYFSG
jgi:Cof subfamily protein (haloacid dehalogenase superfamily)